LLLLGRGKEREKPPDRKKENKIEEKKKGGKRRRKERFSFISEKGKKGRGKTAIDFALPPPPERD